MTASVARLTPVDDREARSQQRIVVELGRLARPFNQDADPIHVTGSAIVVGPRGVLLHRHKRLGMWLQPGGHLEPGEAPWEAAWREAQEETGLRLRWPPLPDVAVAPAAAPALVHVDVHDGGRGHTHLDLRYLLIGSDADPAPPPGESPEARWCGWDEAAGMADEALAPALVIARTEWDVLP